MNVELLVAERRAAWAGLDALIRRAGRRPDRLSPPEIIELGRAYRAAAGDLALVRRRVAPGDPLLARLEDLVRRARGLVYDSEPKRGSLVGFFSRDYWRRIRERPVLLVVAAAGLLLPAALGVVWAYLDDAGARSYLPGFFGGEIGGDPEGLSVDGAAAISSMIFVNNIRVTLLAFAGGVIFGLGTGYILLTNGALLGVLGGIVFQSGQGERFLELVVPHGVLELSCIIATAYAGLRLGWAIVEPGIGPRVTAVTSEARKGVEIVIGTMPWLVLAGLVEGFITPQQIGLGPALLLGFGLGAVWWILVVWRGGALSPDGVADAPSGGGYRRARDFALR